MTYAVFTHKFVFTSASSNYEYSVIYGDVGPHNVLDPSNSTIYHSDYLIYPYFSYFRIDFPISPLYIESFYFLTGINRDPYNWVLEGSNNTVDFITLYNNTNQKICEWGPFDSQTPGCMNITKFEGNITEELRGYYTSIRFRQTNYSSANDNCLVINQIDFIGHIHSYAFTCLHKSITINIHICATLFFLPIILQPK